MLGMANQGGGNGYYGQTAADLMGPFQEEFDLLQAIYARNLCLSLSAEPGVRISVANDLRETPGGWRLPDLAFCSEAWALVRISVTADLLPGGGSLLPLIKATLTYDTDTGSGQSGPVGLALPPVSATAFAAAAEDNSVARRAQEVRFAEFQREAASAARRGDWSQVDAVLEQARSEAQGNEWLSSTMQSLERYAQSRDREQFSKEASFKSRRMMSRLSSQDDDLVFSAAFEEARPRYLRRKVEEGKSDSKGEPG
jgi:Ca-activated chloride channel family protein